MTKFSRILIVCVIAALIVVGGIYIVKNNIFNFSRKIEISGIRENKTYSSTEKIILSGVANPESEIILSWNGQFGLIESDKSGKWIVNLGTMPEGKYSLQMISGDSDKSQSITTTQIIVNDSVKKETKTVSLVDNILNFLTAAISFNQKDVPNQLITIPQSTPNVLQGDWQLLKQN